MLKSTSHRSIQHAKITKKPQYKNQIERKHTFRAFFLSFASKCSSSGGWCQPVESLLYCFDLFIV